MAELVPTDIVGGFYADESLPYSAQRTENLIPEVAEVAGTRTVNKLRGAPGLRLRLALGNLPIRGVHNAEGQLFVVAGQTLFEVFTNWTTANRGSIPGVQRVSIAHNKFGGGHATAKEVSIDNGISRYVYNTQTQSLAQVTDPGFAGSSIADACDGFTTGIDPQGRFWFISNLYQATQYLTTDRQDAESAPDLIRSQIVVNREVMIFGARTIEFFRNTGAQRNTFQRLDGTEMTVGIAAPHARALADNTVFWLGNDGFVYRLNGHSEQRISTRPVEQAIRARNLAGFFCTVFESDGHTVIYFNSNDGESFGFDVATGLWHSRKTHGLKRWRVAHIVDWNGLIIGADYANGNVYTLEWEVYTENLRPMVATRVTGVSHQNQNRVKQPEVEIVIDAGNKPGGSDRVIMVDHSDDGGRNWSNIKYLDMGQVGQYTKRQRARRTGSYRQRVWRMRISGDVKRDILGASASMYGTTG